MNIKLSLNGQVLHRLNASELTEDIIVGRSTKCTWSLPRDQKKVSSRHASIGREGKLVILRDLGSTNGTFIGEERITSRVLQPGDRIRLGQAWIEIDDAGAGADQAASGNGLHLIVRTGPQIGRAFPVKEGVNTIGSSPDCEIHLNDPIVSQRHVELNLSPTGTTITDLGSTNGTVLGKTRLPANQPIPLRPGDHLFIAHYGLVFNRGAKLKRNLLPLILGLVGLLVVAALLAVLLPRLGGGRKNSNPAVDTMLERLAEPGADIDTMIEQLEADEFDDGDLVDDLRRFAEHLEQLRAAEADLLAGKPRDPAAAPSCKDARAQTAADKLFGPWHRKLERWAELADAIRGLPPGATGTLAAWTNETRLAQALAYDCLDAPPPPAARTAPAGAYDEYFGVEDLYAYAFTESEAFGIPPTAETPFTTRLEQLKPILPLCRQAAALDQAMPPGTPVGAQAAALAAVSRIIDNLVVAPPYEDRDALLRVSALRFLGAARISQSDFRRGFEDLRDVVEDAEGAARLKLGIPGDPALRDAWSQVKNP